MQRAIDLARLGSGNVSPNPMVGAVIVLNDEIIGEGYHMQYGEPHAEVNAVNSVSDKKKLSESTIYVTLEPCAHYGKTPPCAELLVKHQFKTVVIGSNDPFEEVNGKGIQILENAGIEVIQHVLKAECDEINKRFFTFHQKKRPFVLLKWAQTQNGFIDINRNKEEKGIKWITQPETKVIVHKWRSEEDAILVGWKTIQNDNPSLNVREYSGKNPLRVILDSDGKAPVDAKVFNDGEPTLLFTTKTNNNNYPQSVTLIFLSEISVEKVLSELYNRKVLSVFVEGGKTTHQSFIDSNLWAEARVLVGNSNWENGVSAPVINKASETQKLGIDTLKVIRNS